MCYPGTQVGQGTRVPGVDLSRESLLPHSLRTPALAPYQEGFILLSLANWFNVTGCRGKREEQWIT